MKKTYFILALIFIYIIIYKLFLAYLGELITYIINPLIWLVLLIIAHFYMPKQSIRDKSNSIVLPIITLLSLIYVICYYSFGIIVGYTNNPFSTSISGVIINLFSWLFIVCIKEYLRNIFMHVKIHKYKFLYYTFVFIVFFISDISILKIIESTNLLDLWVKDLLVPMILNLFMMYLTYVGNYQSAIISRCIIIIPSLLFSVVPDYNWFIIILFNLLFSFFSYLILQYIINKKENSIKIQSTDDFNPRRFIISSIVLFILIAFGLGAFNIKPVAILTGSMEPVISPGDMVIINKCSIEDITIGDIIEFKNNDYNVVHRVIKINYDEKGIGLITKGDANKREDQFIVKSNQIIGKVIIAIPYAGYPAYFIRNIVNNKDDIKIEQGGS